jgi:hypothetical protein
MSDIHKAFHRLATDVQHALDIIESAPSRGRLAKVKDVLYEALDTSESVPQITHAENCWSWGAAHYECACAEIAKLRGWKK